MKRLTGTLIVMALAALTLAQGTFTIRSPRNNETVRETVTVRVPQGSIPEGGYLGIVINGKFMEAVIPEADGTDYIYRLDTVANRIPDGPLTIEIVLYREASAEAAPVVLNRSSVRVNVDNTTSLTNVYSERLLRYGFRKNSEDIYKMKLGSRTSTISQAQAALNAQRGNTADRSIQLSEGYESVRLVYATHNVLRTANGYEAVISVQPRPEPGRSYAWLTVTGDSEPKKYYDHEMAPWYMRMTDTGREVFSGMPFYLPMQGTGASFSFLNLYAFLPLPVLPSEPQAPGDQWQTAILQSARSIEEFGKEESGFAPIPAQATLKEYVYYRGYKCAHIVAEAGQTNARVGQLLTGQGAEADGPTQSFQAILDFYLDLESGRMISQTRRYITQVEITNQPAGGAGGGQGSGPARPGMSGAGGGGGSASSGVAGEWIFPNRVPNSLNMTYGDQLWIFDPVFDQNGQLIQTFRVQQRPGGGPGNNEPRGGRGGQTGRGGQDDMDRGMGFGNNQPRQGGGSAGRRIIRIETYITMDLDDGRS
ncbi:MAG: hypothetical protein KF812_02955 [Fimbriimonadaceae bacterium]|nr:hypothetical protein [Fimbriimonadaceae bacterium]